MQRLNEKQIQELLKCAYSAINQKETLTSVFKFIAQKYSLSPGSVRNVYYKVIKEKKIKNLKAKKVEQFSKQEEEIMLKKILINRKNCSSMRQAFLLSASGDEKLAMRYQNKYCNMLKKQRSTVMREVLLQKKLTGECYNPYISKQNKKQAVKLKCEINQLIKIITEKCAKENALLKKKMIAYQKLQESEIFFKNESTLKSGAKEFFNSSQTKKKLKVN